MKATKHQLQFLKELGAQNVGGISKEEATKLIDKLLAEEYASGKNFKCPSCKSEFSPRPKRRTVCKECGNAIVHLSGRFYTEEKADEKCQRDWLSECRTDNRDAVREEWSYEKFLRKERNGPDEFGYRIKICPACTSAYKFNGVLVPFEVVVEHVNLLPPYETCDRHTCECEYETVYCSDVKDNAVYVTVSQTGEIEFKRIPVRRKTNIGCIVLPLLASATLTAITLSWLISVA
jgi:hypothetical protein